MCTIITCDKANWDTHKTAIVDQISADALCNRDGWSLVVCRAEGSLSVESMDVTVILSVLNSLTTFGRFWLHARAATGSKLGIAYCHGFRTKAGYLVQHNGIISNPDDLPVDSMRIGQLIDTIGVEATIGYFYDSKETFFNTFIIEPEYGSYDVVRIGSGTLYTNEASTVYSTKPIVGVADLAVPAGYWEAHAAIYEKAKPTITTHYPTSWYDRNWDRQDDYTDTGKYWEKPSKGKESHDSTWWRSDLFFDRLDRKEYLTTRYDDFFDDWTSAGCPEMSLTDLDAVPINMLYLFDSKGEKAC